MTIDKLQAEMDAQLQFPGFPNVWTQPIRNRLDMLLTGIKTPVGIKILGSDLNEIQRLGGEIERTLQSIPGTRSVYAERVAQGYFTDIRIDREAIARHGLMIGDVEDVIESAIGGQNITRTIEGRERYPVNVRYEQGFRDTLPDLQRVLVKTPAGAQIPLAQLAEITLTPGPAMIRDENGQLAGYVYVDTATTDIGGYVDQAKRAIAEHLKLPAGYTLLWTGQYEFQVRARERFKILIPLVFFIIFMLLYMTFHSASEATIVMLSVVYAMTGGVILQWLLGYNFSVAVWVGYIALYGVAVQTGVVMVVYLHEALDKRLRQGGTITEEDIRQATIAGSVLRLRPKLMTVSVVMAALVPILWSTGVGSDIMKPIAAPIIGGMVTSTIHVLIITPVIFYLMKPMGPFWTATANCLRASLGDAAIVTALWSIGAYIFESPDWFRRASATFIGALALFGGLIGVGLERVALGGGRWAYSSTMPVIPGLGVGVAPVLQMALLPPLLMRLAASAVARARRGGARHDPE